jgi:mannose-1-phosphate guanylyltransferase
MLLPVIMSGGSGTRLWPLSRSQHPKPFIKLPDGESLIQKTYLRAVKLPGVSNILTITNRDYYFLSKDELDPLHENYPDLHFPFLLEPKGRNTAPAITLAAIKAAETYGSDTILLVLSADHLINEHDCFAEAVAVAAEAAKNDKLVTFGIQPTHAATGFGYIEYQQNSDDDITACEVIQFVEKPAREIAEQYLSSGNFVWNSGMFCFKASTLLNSIQEHAPDIYEMAMECWSVSTSNLTDGTDTATELDKTTFSALPDISIDYAIMEKASNVMVVPSPMEWSDVGCWEALGNLTEQDCNGNRVEGEAVLVDVKNSYFNSQNRVLTGIGVEDLIVVDTPDALLLAHRERVQDVKQIVSELKLKNHESADLHTTVKRPWGAYTVLEEGACYKIKRIVVKPNASLSLQSHQHRNEHWVVVSGQAKIVNGEDEFILNENESTYIPAGNLHRLSNASDECLSIIEVQAGSYLGEDDIIRYDDIYGRDDNIKAI